MDSSYVPFNTRCNTIAVEILIAKFKTIFGPQPLKLSTNFIFDQSPPSFEILSLALRMNTHNIHE